MSRSQAAALNFAYLSTQGILPNILLNNLHIDFLLLLSLHSVRTVTKILHSISFSGTKILTMPTLPAEAMSLVITRNARQSDFCEQHDPATNRCYGPQTKADNDVVLGLCIGFGLLCFCLLLRLRPAIVRKRLRESPHSTSDYFREFFIFRSFCGKRTKHSEPLEQHYQPYEMMRSQGHHDAEAGANKGFGDVSVSAV